MSFKLHFRNKLPTILYRIEVFLISNPLCPINNIPQDIVALTPGNFLIVFPILASPKLVIHLRQLTITFCK